MSRIKTLYEWEDKQQTGIKQSFVNIAINHIVRCLINLLMDLDPKKVNNLFFTHHHSDHDLDYPCFLLTRWETSIGNEENLNIYGPPPTELLTTRLIDLDIGAFAHDLIARTNHPLSLWEKFIVLYLKTGVLVYHAPVLLKVGLQ